MTTPRARSWISSLVVVLALSPRAAFAWSANGHKAVALIAQSRLTESAKNGIAALLGSATMDGVAPCADDVRGKSGYDCDGIQLNDDPQSEPWHFVDAPIADSPADGNALESYCANQACVIDQINKDVQILKTSNVTSDRQLALIFLIHFVGDEHQPLHCSDEIVNGVNDRGGNLKNVKFNGVAKSGGYALNLHALWDHQILSGDTNDPAATSQRLISDLANKDVSSWTSGDFVHDAAFESYTIAKNTVYPAYYQTNGVFGASYSSQMVPIVDDRLERAGVRLAALLNSVFDGSGNGSVSAPPSDAAPVERARRRVKNASDTSAL
jgi:hypothetical protein